MSNGIQLSNIKHPVNHNIFIRIYQRIKLYFKGINPEALETIEVKLTNDDIQCEECFEKMNYHPFRGYVCFNLKCKGKNNLERRRMKGYPQIPPEMNKSIELPNDREIADSKD